MYKVFTYSKGKFVEQFTHIKFEDLVHLQEQLSNWYKIRRSDQSREFLICDEDKYIKTLNSTHFEPEFNLEKYEKQD